MTQSAFVLTGSNCKTDVFWFLALHNTNAFFGNLQHSVTLCGIQSVQPWGKNDQIPFNLKAVCKSTLKICLEKIVDQTEKSGKVGPEIINVEVQIIMPSGTPGSQPWIYIFTASSLPSIGIEGPGFSKNAWWCEVAQASLAKLHSKPHCWANWSWLEILLSNSAIARDNESQ